MINLRPQALPSPSSGATETPGDSIDSKCDGGDDS